MISLSWWPDYFFRTKQNEQECFYFNVIISYLNLYLHFFTILLHFNIVRILCVACARLRCWYENFFLRNKACPFFLVSQKFSILTKPLFIKQTVPILDQRENFGASLFLNVPTFSAFFIAKSVNLFEFRLLNQSWIFKFANRFL